MNTNQNSISSEQLKSFVEQIESLEEEKSKVGDSIKDIYAVAKGTGFDIKVIRQLIRVRKLEKQERLEQEELLELYMKALGM